MKRTNKVRPFPDGHSVSSTTQSSEITQVSLYTGPTSAGADGTTVVVTRADGSKEYRTGPGHPLRDNNPGDIEYGPFARSAGAIGADGNQSV